MPRKAKGTWFVSDGSVYASVTIAPKTRLARALPFVALDDAAMAAAWAHTLQELVDAIGAEGRDGGIVAKLDLAVRVGRDHPDGDLDRVAAGIAKLRLHAAPAALAAVAPRTAMTVKRFGTLWTSGDLHREYPDHIPEKRSADKDAGILERWV